SSQESPPEARRAWPRIGGRAGQVRGRAHATVAAPKRRLAVWLSGMLAPSAGGDLLSVNKCAHCGEDHGTETKFCPNTGKPVVYSRPTMMMFQAAAGELPGPLPGAPLPGSQRPAPGAAPAAARPAPAAKPFPAPRAGPP